MAAKALNRRQFVKSGALLGASLTIVPAAQVRSCYSARNVFTRF